MIKNPEFKIKQIRELKNLSQEYVASELGISTRAYSKIETGETQLNINRLNEISSILEVDPMEILGFDEKKIFNIHNHSTGTCWGVDKYSQNFPEKLVAQYEETIQSLKEQVRLLKQLLEHKQN
ncbi:XRE family transcriptional regulator [Ornithobacterium rhinotracheale]|uniref:XRE family transcriptional regulator n=1 Tax=Ornithobacterium rhinotracheale TaxID=28251 RepID=A0A410JU61_ORNRH|nr:helix-turn-helix transcriptional regulator [Ornithobacterium rhinotracheale]QAR31736.1 XRE family transcriptional regulator [Ornithobacterium rhinotracheale]